MFAIPIRVLACTVFSLSATVAHAANLQLDSPTLSKSGAVKVHYSQVPTTLPPGQMVQLLLMRLEGNKEDQVYVRKLDLAKGDSGVHDFGPAYFPGRYEVRLILVGDQPLELARVPLQVVEQAPAIAAPASAPSATAPFRTGGAAAPKGTACSGTPSVSGPVPSGAPSPAEVASALRSVLSETYAPIAGSAADVCVEFGTLNYRGQQDRKMLSEYKAPAQTPITSWVVAMPVTITIHKRRDTEVKQRGGRDEVFLFFRDGGSWNYRTGRP